MKFCLFDMYDWNKILCLKYIGEDEKDEEQFQEQLEMYGIKEMDAVLSKFLSVTEAADPEKLATSDTVS